ncbi:hypothetical protein XELAEV_18002864mg [Xenopus laevis]|uniref:Uncharacterized protein n=1 Tax=Xenopus laevis TaxID=8355 RepID=A0A974GYK4_XENLA|nr:hypothetical protein XELAEV_18002864mg [Xenopus laevis]
MKPKRRRRYRNLMRSCEGLYAGRRVRGSGGANVWPINELRTSQELGRQSLTLCTSCSWAALFPIVRQEHSLGR